MSQAIPHFLSSGPKVIETAESIFITNPATGAQIGRLYPAGAEVCSQAVSSAAEAFVTWSETTPSKRIHILFKFRELLDLHQMTLAQTVTREHGKTLEDARGSIARAIELVTFHCGLLSQLQGVVSMDVANQVDCLTMRYPLGVCAGVSPFNFPVMVPVWMMIPAIAAGNTFILKPSEQAPSAPNYLVEWLLEAGLPKGVVQCIHGDKTTVNHLLNHKGIAAFTAVASTPVAEAIYQQAVKNGKRAHTFGGAKNHCVVMPDADINEAARAIVGAAFGSAGERCMAISVVVAVGDEVASQLLEKVVPLVDAMHIGAGDLPETDMGPLISAAHRARVISAIDAGEKEGATLLIDGRAFKHKKHPNGYYLGPTLFDNVTEEMSIYQQEIFGPVLVMVRVPDFDAAVALVNRNQYGNGTSIFTSRGYDAREYTRRVQVGMVGVNIPIPVPIASHPFGGWKRSSFGDTNMHGLESIHFYTKLKTVTSRWSKTDERAHGFSMPTHHDKA